MRKVSVFLSLIMLALLAGVPALAQLAQDEGQELATILEIVTAAAEGDGQDPEFTVLEAAIQVADPFFRTALANPDLELTVFAPTDAAFAELIQALGTNTQNLLADVALLNDLLSYHIVPGLLRDDSFEAMDGGIIGTVLAGESLKILLSEGNIFINASRILIPNLLAANGIVHVVDTVLAPAPKLELVATGTLAEIIIANAEDSTPEFTTLLAAAQAADPALLQALTGNLPYTLFAPTDAAFRRALDELGVTAEALLQDTQRLNDILAYHIVPGRFAANDLLIMYLANVGTPRLSTALPGLTLDLFLQNNRIVMNYASVILPDVLATNGVLHVIDSVLIPPR